MIDIIKNINKITTIPKSQLDDVVHKAQLCIAHEVIDLDETNPVIDLDIGIGILSLVYADDNITYRFRPSQGTEKLLISAIKSGQSPIVQECEKKITERILTTYKELL